MQILDIYLKVVWRIKTDKYQKLILAPIVIIPIISVIGFLSMQAVGYTKGWAFCFTMAHAHDTDLYFYFSILAVVQLFAVCMFIMILFRALFWIQLSRPSGKIEPYDANDEEEDITAERVDSPPPMVIKDDKSPSGTTSSTADADAEADLESAANAAAISCAVNHPHLVAFMARMRVLKAPIMFVIVYSLNVTFSIALRIESRLGASKQNRIFDQWTDCIFQNFYTNYDIQFPDDYYNVARRNEFAHSVCGDASGDGYNNILFTIVLVAVFACSVYISLIFCRYRFCWLLWIKARSSKILTGTHESSQSFVTMNVDEIRSFNEPSKTDEEEV